MSKPLKPKKPQTSKFKSPDPKPVPGSAPVVLVSEVKIARREYNGTKTPVLEFEASESDPVDFDPGTVVQFSTPTGTIYEGVVLEAIASGRSVLLDLVNGLKAVG